MMDRSGINCNATLPNYAFNYAYRDWDRSEMRSSISQRYTTGFVRIHRSLANGITEVNIPFIYKYSILNVYH